MALKEEKIKPKIKQTLKVKINKEKGQGCSAFGSCLIKNVKNANISEDTKIMLRKKRKNLPSYILR